MTMKSMIASLMVGISLAAVADDNPMGAQAQVEVGKWCSDFVAAQEYAEANNIPLLVFWANPGCSQCEKLENACKESDFLAWQAQRQMVMVFAYGQSSTAQKKAYQWIRSVTKLTKFPFIGVYWKSNGAGQEVRSAFTGRKGMMPVTSGSLQEQLMNSVDQLTAGWSPSGAPAPVTPTPVPEQDVRAQAYGSSRNVSLLVSDAQLDTYIGTATASIGKLKNGQVKVMIKTTLFNGKSLSANKTVDVEKNGSAAGTLAFKDPLGAAVFSLSYDAGANAVSLVVKGEQCNMDQTNLQIGGTIPEGVLAFNGSVAALPTSGYAFVTDAAPVGEPVYVQSGSRFKFDKAPTLKYKKVDGEYVLDGLDDPGKPNENSLKLSYKSKSGIFSGTYYAYISNAATATGKPKLTKCKATVKGAFVGGRGYGEILLTVGKIKYAGSCEIVPAQ